MKDRHSPKWHQQITRLNIEDARRLKKYAKQEKQTESDVIRELIRNHCTDFEND